MPCSPPREREILSLLMLAAASPARPGIARTSQPRSPGGSRAFGDRDDWLAPAVAVQANGKSVSGCVSAPSLQRDQDRNQARTIAPRTECLSDHRAERPDGILSLHGVTGGGRTGEQVTDFNSAILCVNLAVDLADQCDRLPVGAILPVQYDARLEITRARDNPRHSLVVGLLAPAQTPTFAEDHHRS